MDAVSVAVTEELLTTIHATPVNFLGFDHAIATNFDGTIDPVVMEHVSNHPEKIAQHAAWDFCGYVWHDGDAFHEQVWQMNIPVAQYSCAEYEPLRDHVNELYGDR